MNEWREHQASFSDVLLYLCDKILDRLEVLTDELGGRFDLRATCDLAPWSGIRGQGQ